jgi:hypothetical protein
MYIYNHIATRHVTKLVDIYARLKLITELDPTRLVGALILN